MKLLTHNMLKSHVKGVKNGYPLLIRAEEVEVEETEFNPEFIVRMLPRLEWSALVTSMQQLGMEDKVVAEVPEDAPENEEFLRMAHHALLEVRVLTGELECPESGKVFPIKRGIPNMLLDEDEV